jgi:hypothetical protein
MGCVSMTYVAPLKKYVMCVTDGWPTVSKMSTFLLESSAPTGPWRLVHYFKEFGPQAYFVNLPSKFIRADGRGAWLCYSANFAFRDTRRDPEKGRPRGSAYGLVLQEVVLEPAAKR